MDIISNRIPATPRSKYTKYDTGSNSNVYTNGTTVDLSNTVKLKGKTDQTVDGNLSATGDIVAYQTTAATLTLPIASTASLGCMKVGNNLTIAEDGTLNAEAGGASSWSDITDKPSTFIPAAHTHTTSDITDLSTYLHTHSNKTILDGISSTLVSNWNTAYTNNHTHSNKTVLDGITSTNTSNWNTAYSNSHWHSNKSYLDNINQNLSTTSAVQHSSMKCTSDVVAYSTGSTTDTTAHASTTAYGAVKYDGSTISVNSSGQLYAVKSYGCDGSTILANSSNNLYVNASAFPNNMNLSTSVGGVLGLTKTANSQRWDIAGFGTLQFYYKSSSASNGTLEAQIDTDGSYVKNSDVRLKNISGTENSILNKIDNITPIYYSMKSDPDKKECLGLSAQEVQATLPKFVHIGSDGYLGLDYAGIGAVVAVEGCKELYSIIKTQQSKIDELEKRIQALENK